MEITRIRLGLVVRTPLRCLTPSGNKRGLSMAVGSPGQTIGRDETRFKVGWIASIVLRKICSFLTRFA